MWISKNKLARIENEQYIKAMRNEMDATEAIEQANRLRELEKAVKKLKKIVKGGY